MIAYPRLGKVGRLGNQLFQVAFLTSFSEKYGVEYFIPPWPYAEHFSHPFSIHPALEDVRFSLVTREPALGFHEEHFVRFLPEILRDAVSIETGYFQSFKYFSKQHVLKIFAPRIPPLRRESPDAVAISVRRGNFVHHRCYNRIDAATYLEILDRHFPGCEVGVFSDDFAYCRAHFVGPRFQFFDTGSDVDQLIAMAQFENFILSNSTFSYWGAMLSPNPRRVFYPRNMFTDPKACRLYNRDYWPADEAYVGYENEINKPCARLPGIEAL